MDEELSERLVSYYLTKFAQSPQAHDKVEFGVQSCYTVDIDDRMEELRSAGFDNDCDKLSSSLRNLTNTRHIPKMDWAIRSKSFGAIKVPPTSNL